MGLLCSNAAEYTLTDPIMNYSKSNTDVTLWFSFSHAFDSCHTADRSGPCARSMGKPKVNGFQCLFTSMCQFEKKNASIALFFKTLAGPEVGGSK